MPSPEQAAHSCGLCRKTFSQKSSLVRHAKRCTLEPRPSVRQKACRACTAAKVRCDTRRPECGKCSSRGVDCIYATAAKATRREDDERHGRDGGGHSSRDDETASAAATTASFPSGVPISLLDGMEMHTGLMASSSLSNCPLAAAVASQVGAQAQYPTPGSGGGGEEQQQQQQHTPAMDFELAEGGLGLGCSDEDADTAQLVARALDLEPPFNTELGSGGRGGASRGEAIFPEYPIPTTSSGTEPVGFSSWELPSVLPAGRDRSGADEDAGTAALIRHSRQSLQRVFRSWPRALAKELQLPPIIHHSQLLCGGSRQQPPRILANCIALCKMWVGQHQSTSTCLVRAAVKEESGNIFNNYLTLDAPELLAAIQALTLYTVLFLFPQSGSRGEDKEPEDLPRPVCDEFFERLQDVTSHVLSTGMLLREESAHERPPWPVWAHIEAKRRTVLALYYLHWSQRGRGEVAAWQGRWFRCATISHMRAPGPRFLWQAVDGGPTWRSLYNKWLAQWEGRELVQSDFRSVAPGPSMHARLEMWLEDADEFGMLIFSTINAIGIPPNKDNRMLGCAG